MQRAAHLRNALLSSLFLSSTAFATETTEPYYAVDGLKSVQMPIETESDSRAYLNANLDAETLAGVKTIQLMSIAPSEKLLADKKAIRAVVEAGAGEMDYSNGIIPFSESRDAVNLGMNNTPVLDQGQYGTCVTFSTTAALDATFSLGDAIDQQCSLALNLYLGNDWWNGAYYPSQIIDPIKEHGYVQKDNCFGSKYPTRNQKVTTSKYESISNRELSSNMHYTYYQGSNLSVVKNALNKGNRVLIGFLLLANTPDPVSIQGFNLNVKGTKKTGGLWACKQPGNQTNYCLPSHAGHEVVVTGFDDKQQLLKIRNSWNTRVGDSGEFYMTYDFYNSMVLDNTVVYK